MENNTSNMEHTMSEYEHGLKDGINMGVDRMKKTLIDQIKHNCSGTEVKKILENRRIKKFYRKHKKKHREQLTNRYYSKLLSGNFSTRSSRTSSTNIY